MKRLRRQTATLAACAFAASLHAQITHHVALSSFESGPWVFHPIYAENSATAAVSIDDFVAVLDDSASTGDNLVAVWFRRDAGTGNWEGWSWDTTQRWAALNHVKSILSLDPAEDDRWKVSGDGLGISALTAEEFGYGVLASDALADDIPVSPDPDALIALLVASGYRAASLSVQHLDGCKVNDKLDGMAMAFRETLFEPASTAFDRMMTKWFESGSAGCDLGDDGIAIIDFPIHLDPAGPASFKCYPWVLPPVPPDTTGVDCTVLEWTWTNVVSQKRTRGRFNPTPPPLYEFCDQTRLGLLTTIVTCQSCMPADPCPQVPPGTTPPIGAGCSAGSFDQPRVISLPVVWNEWVPPCPF